MNLRSRACRACGAAGALLLLVACEKPAAEPYTPGVGEIMAANQMRHAKLWLAGQASNWPLAAYEVDELEEGFGDLIKYHPVDERSSAPLAEMAPRMTAGPLHALHDAIEKRDRDAFTSAFDELTQGCNACHRATGFGFNVVARPGANPFPNQIFAPLPGAG